MIKVLILLLIFFGISAAHADVPGDYASYPDQQFRFHHLQGEFDISGNPVTIEATVNYTVSAYLDGYDEIVMHASGIDVEQVTANGNDLDFSTTDNQLVISLHEAANRDEEFEIEISYTAQPQFGVHHSARGTIWTSSLPASNRHWLPGPDHPRNRVSTDLTFLVDENKKVVSPGIREDTGQSGGRNQVNWQSEDALPVSDLGFAVGDFIETDTFFGTRRLRVFAEEAAFSESDKEQILQRGYDRLRRAEGEVGHSFPFDEFSVIMLEDDFWEPRNFSAGLGWVFASRGDLENQLYSTLYSQWFGIYRQAERWADASAVQGYQSWVAHIFDDEDLPEMKTYSLIDNHPETNYSRFSPDSLNRAKEWFTENENAPYTISLMESSSQLLSEGREVYSWRDFSDMWYRNTGRLWDEAPTLPYTPAPDTLEYIADVSFSGSAGRVTFNFEPVGHNTDEQIPATVRIYKDQETITEQIDVPGSGGEVQISIEELVESAHVVSGENQPLRIKENKDISMWLHQLRNADSAEARKDAAVALREFDENPDLQLALRDVINHESDSGVLAEIYRSLGQLSRGASGTQNTFIQGLQHSDREVQIASLEALSHYTDNSEVSNEVFEIISLSEDVEKVYKAVGVYRQLNPEDYFIDFIDRFLTEDEDDLEFTPGLIDELFRTDDVDYAINRTQQYLESNYPFEIRYKVWRYLREHDTSDADWQNRVDTYINDPDPRMRMLALSEMQRFDDIQVEEWLAERHQHEFDKRVHRTIEEMIP